MAKKKNTIVIPAKLVPYLIREREYSTLILSFQRRLESRGEKGGWIAGSSPTMTKS